MSGWARRAAFAVLLGPFALAQGQPAGAQPDNARGQALYESGCHGCHKEQIHWRDAKSVHDWASLRATVRHWETAARLHWRNEDVEAVAQYLNALYYHYALPA